MSQPEEERSPGPGSPELAGDDPEERYKSFCAVVIDTGTSHTRSGLAGDEKPRSVVPSRVEGPRQQDDPGLGDGGSILTHGVVTDWDGLETLWHRVFYRELAVCPEELAVLVTDAPLSPAANREKVAELLFESFGVPAMLVLPRSLLAAYSYGRTSGLVVGSGAGTSYVAPILDGYALPHATFRLDVAGDALTAYLGELRGARGPPLPPDLLRQLKEHCCCCQLPGAPAPAPAVDFTLPDKRVVSVGSERFRCPEALFAPAAVGLPAEPGLAAQAARSLRRCGARRRGRLLADVLLAGGTTLLSGFAERLGAELRDAAGAAAAGPAAGPRRRFAAWLGGSIAASLDAFQSAWIAQRAYGESGAAVVHRHCF
ncbi:actin-3-like [Rhea pennata]|uniref:actin-3-like n=1 Tax=Rhea pennata TaxID=8795 RepID=UPI002E259B44